MDTAELKVQRAQALLRTCIDEDPGISALITTFGVGETSVLNAVAGAYAELTPLVHIVGSPSTVAQQAGLCLHHTVGNGDFRVFANMFASITVAQANLSNAETAALDIDRVLKACIEESRPVYIELPSDMVLVKISSTEKLFRSELKPETICNDNGCGMMVVETILQKIYAARSPIIIVDGLVRNFRVVDEVNALVQLLGFPTTTTPFGKGTVEESHPNVVRMYAGATDDTEYQAFFKACDLFIWLGPLQSDTNTFGYTTLPPVEATIAVHPHNVKIGTREHALAMKPLLRKLLRIMDISRLPKSPPFPVITSSVRISNALAPVTADRPLQHDIFWLRMSRFLRPGDVVLTECGTSTIGGRELVLPPNVTMISSLLWLSIGTMLGAAQGVILALRDLEEEGSPTRRTILFIGDGSLQISVQSISDIIRNRLDVVIFVINNEGYTIERYIHGMKAAYNDVQPWRYLEAAKFFGASFDDSSYPVVSCKAATWGEMQKVMIDPAVQAGRGLVMVEIAMAREDAPEGLKKLFPPQ